MAQGSGGYGGPDFAAVEGQLRNVAIQFTSILQIQLQIRASVDAWRTLERELTLSAAAASATRNEFNQMEAAARNFALASNYSASQVANAFYNIASAGFTARETLSAATGVILLAQASLTDLGEASDITSSALRQFNLVSAESYRVSNLFVAATNSSLATVPKLAFALRQVGPIAAQSNLSIEQTVGVLDKLFDVGLRGEQAGTALRNAIVRLQNPVGDGAKLMQAYGVSLTGVNGKTKDFLQTITELAKTDIGQNGITQIFGVEASAGAAALIDSIRKSTANGSNELLDHIKNITNTNAAYRQATMQMQTLDGQLNILANSFNDFRISIGQALAPVIRGFTGEIVDFVEAFRDMDAAAKLNTLSWGLWAVQGVAAIKLMAATGEGLGNLFGTTFTDANGKIQTTTGSITKMTTGFGQLSTAGKEFIQGVPIARTMGNISQGVQGVTAGLTSMIGTVAGLAGLAVVIYSIASAISAANDAADKARIQKVTDNYYQLYAKDKNLSPDQLSRLQDNSDYAGQYEKAADGIGKLFTGTNVYQKVRAQSALIDQGSDDLKTLALKAKAQVEQFKQFGQENLRLVNAMSEAYDHFYQGAPDKLEVSLGESRSDPSSYTKQIIDELAKLGNTGAGNAKTALADYYDRRIAEANADKTLATAERTRIVSLANDIKATILSGSEQSAEIVIKAAKEAADKAQKRISSNGGDDRALGFGPRNTTVTLSNTLKDFFENVKSNTAITAEQVEANVREIQQQFNRIKATMDKLKADLPNLDTGLSTQLVEQIATSTSLTPEQRAVFMKAINSDAGKKALANVSEEVRKNGLSYEDAVKLLGQQINASRLGISAAFTREVSAGYIAPIIDLPAVEKIAKDAEIADLKAQLRIAELLKQPGTLGKMIEIQRRERDAQNDETVTQFFGLIGGTADATVQSALASARNNSAERKTVEEAILEYASQDADRRKVALDKLTNFLVGKGMNRSALRDLGAVLNALGTVTRARDSERKGALTQYQQSQANQISPEQDILKMLLGLPSDEELALSRAQTAVKTRYAVANYLGLPLATIGQAAEEAVLDYQQKLQSFQKKYENFFVSTLSKGVGEGLISDELRDAFSGKLLSDALTKGSTTFDGKTYTADALKSTKGLQDFLAAIASKFGGVVADAPGATERIKQAKRLLGNMSAEQRTLFDEYSAQLELNRLKANDVQRKVNEFLAQFDQQKLIDAFDSALRENALGSKGAREITMDLAVNARVAEVKINGLEALTKLRNSYSEYFRNMNIPVTINPTTGQFEQVSLAQQQARDPLQLAGTALTSAAKDLSAAAAELRGGGSGSVGSSTATSLKEVGLELKRMGLKVGENPNFGGVGLGHKGAGHREGRAIDVNAVSGVDANNPQAKAKLDAVAKQYQAAGYVILWNGQRYDPSGGVTKLASGANQHTDHLHLEEPRGGAKRRGGNSDNVIQIPSAQAPTPEELVAQRAREFANQRYIDQVNREIVAREKYNAELEAFFAKPENYVSAANRLAEGFLKAYDAVQGEISAAIRASLERGATRNDLQSEALQMAASRPGADQGQFRGQRAQLQVERERIDLYIKQEQLLNEITRQSDAERQVLEAKLNSLRKVPGTAAEQAKVQAEITDLTEREARAKQQVVDATRDAANSAGTSVSSQRELQKQELDALMKGGDRDGNSTDSIWKGMEAGALESAMNIKSVFEVAMEGTKMAIEGLTDAASDLFFGSAKDAEQAVAQMLKAIAKLIIQMLILRLVKSALGGMFGDGGVGGDDGGMSGSVGIGRNALGGIGGIQKFAEGGIGFAEAIARAHGYANAVNFGSQDMRAGGVRQPRNAAVAIFGEGQHPEAFIPMMDRKSIQVVMDSAGNAHVPLPSGKSIPVTMLADQKAVKYAQGGVANDNQRMPMALRAAKADRAMASERDAVAPYRGNDNGSARGQTSNSYQIPISLTVQGNMTPETVPAVTDTLIKSISALLDAREAESRRKDMQRSQTLNSMGQGFQ